MNFKHRLILLRSSYRIQVFYFTPHNVTGYYEVVFDSQIVKKQRERREMDPLFFTPIDLESPSESVCPYIILIKVYLSNMILSKLVFDHY